jgi:hypothetical protein
MLLSLQSVLPIPNPEKYKAHLACWNQHYQPLDVFVRDRNEWHQWNTWRSQKDDFNREFIFSLIDFYPEQNIWLFGGIYRVLSRNNKNYSHSYTVELLNDSAALIGRLKLRLKRPGRVKSVRLEKYYSEIVVSEILKEPYSGEVFCGYENINHDFGLLEAVFRAQRADWKGALEHIKGVYLIADKSNGKKYVGSAYGESGVWSRWSCYIGTGHGWNDELTKLIETEGLDYARKNFRMSLLEHRSMRTEDSVILERENYWKEALLSRGKHGYNKN